MLTVCCCPAVQGPLCPPGLRHGDRCVNAVNPESKCWMGNGGEGRVAGGVALNPWGMHAWSYQPAGDLRGPLSLFPLLRPQQPPAAASPGQVRG